MSYQAWVYRVDTLPRLCLSAGEYASALADGWVDSPVAVAMPEPSLGSTIGYVHAGPDEPAPASVLTVTAPAAADFASVEPVAESALPEPAHDVAPAPKRRRGRPPRKAQVYTHDSP